MDTRSPEQRRKIMQSVGQKDTGPELKLRKALHSIGYRYRLHAESLPGRPDIAFPSRKKAIFVHGCFWHGHSCSKGRLPKSRPEYWKPKIEANKARDERVVEKLMEQGWACLTVWQCETKSLETIVSEVVRFLGPPGPILRSEAQANWSERASDRG